MGNHLQRFPEILKKMKTLTGMLKEGNRLKVAGNYEFDEYLHSFVIKVTSALLIPAPPVRQDTYPKKRVELHMHTKNECYGRCFIRWVFG